MEGYGAPGEPGALIPFAWSPGWNSPQAWNKFQDEVGGHLLAGDPGVRLIEASGAGGYAAAGSHSTAALSVAPIWHIHGSEELSARAPAVSTLVPKAYLALNPADAAALGLAADAVARFRVGEQVLEAPVAIREHLARGVLGVPAGLPDMPWAPLSGAATLAQGGN
jgi:NADH-quinone oxidoreductase subunit G